MASSPAAIYLTIEQVLEVHNQAIAATDGCGGVRSPDALAAAVLQPQQTFGSDLYPTIAEKAAAYGYFIAENQPFLNGNKRTAAATMLVFLDLNGCDFSPVR